MSVDSECSARLGNSSQCGSQPNDVFVNHLGVSSTPCWYGLAKIKSLVVFGDSYSASPSREKWVAYFMQDAKFGGNPTIQNFARDGDTAEDDLDEQLTAFVASQQTVPPDAQKYDTLYVIWIGINDCFQSDPEDLEERTERVIEALDTLYVKAKARSFLIIDVPPIDRTPQAVEATANLADACGVWNSALTHRCKEWAFDNARANVFLFSAHNTISRVLDDPTEYDFQEEDAEEAGGGIWKDELHLTADAHRVLVEDLRAAFGSLHEILPSGEVS